MKYRILAIVGLLGLSLHAQADNLAQDEVLTCTNGTAGASVAPWVSNCPTFNQVYKVPVASDIVATDSKTGTWQPYGPLVGAKLVRTCLKGSSLNGASCGQVAGATATTGSTFKAKQDLSFNAAAPPPPKYPVILGNSITVSWETPTQNVDGSALDAAHLVGYQFAFSANGGALTDYPTDAAPTAVQFVFPLPPGDYCFTIKTVALDDQPGGAHIFSAPSDPPACATLQPKPTALPSTPKNLAIKP